MSKKIRLDESALRRIIRESLEELLGEPQGPREYFPDFKGELPKGYYIVQSVIYDDKYGADPFVCVVDEKQAAEDLKDVASDPSAYGPFRTEEEAHMEFERQEAE